MPNNSNNFNSPKIKSYKGVRITRCGDEFYAKLDSTETIVINSDNVLRIFETCTSFCAEIQTRLYNLGPYGLYPEHSEEFKIYITLPEVEFTSTVLPKLTLKLNNKQY